MALNIKKINRHPNTQKYTYNQSSVPQTIDYDTMYYTPPVDDTTLEVTSFSPEELEMWSKLDATGALLGLSVIEGGAMVVEAGFDLAGYATGAVLTPAAALSDKAQELFYGKRPDVSGVDSLWEGVKRDFAPQTVKTSFDEAYQGNNDFLNNLNLGVKDVYDSAYYREFTRLTGNTLGECLTVGQLAAVSGASEAAIYSFQAGLNRTSSDFYNGKAFDDAFKHGVAAGFITGGAYGLKSKLGNVDTLTKMGAKGGIALGKNLLEQANDGNLGEGGEGIDVQESMTSAVKGATSALISDKIKMPEKMNEVVKDSVEYTIADGAGNIVKDHANEGIDAMKTSLYNDKKSNDAE